MDVQDHLACGSQVGFQWRCCFWCLEYSVFSILFIFWGLIICEMGVHKQSLARGVEKPLSDCSINSSNALAGRLDCSGSFRSTFRARKSCRSSFVGQ